MCNIFVYIYLHISTCALHCMHSEFRDLHLFLHIVYIYIYTPIYMYCLYVCIEFQVFCLTFPDFPMFSNVEVCCRWSKLSSCCMAVCQRAWWIQRIQHRRTPRRPKERMERSPMCTLFSGESEGKDWLLPRFQKKTLQKSMMTSMLILYKKPGFKNGNRWKWCVLNDGCNLRYWHHLKIGIVLLPTIMAEWKVAYIIQANNHRLPTSKLLK